MEVCHLAGSDNPAQTGGRILNSLARLKRYDPDVDISQIVDDLYFFRSYLLLCRDAFAVVTEVDGTLHVHIGCAFTGNCPSLLAELDQVIDCARQLELTALTFASPRKGWHRLAQKYGFELIDGEYVRKL